MVYPVLNTLKYDVFQYYELKWYKISNDFLKM